MISSLQTILAGERPRTISRGRRAEGGPLAMKSHQLMAQGEVPEDELFPGAKAIKNPAEQVSKTHRHPRILTKCAQRRLSPK